MLALDKSIELATAFVPSGGPLARTVLQVGPLPLLLPPLMLLPRCSLTVAVSSGVERLKC